MARVKRPSFLKRQKEQARLAKARAKQETRLARRRARKAVAEGSEPTEPEAAVHAPGDQQPNGAEPEGTEKPETDSDPQI
jgi:hypothetical protein